MCWKVCIERTFSPRDFGQLIARSTKTLQRWDREGILTAKRTPTGRRYYTHEDYLAVTGQRAHQRVNVAYCRVSASGQKSDLANQKDAVERFCIAAGKEIHVKMEDLGSGLNYKRRNFCRLMEMVERGEVAELIAHKDRLVRFGYEWFEAFCEAHGTKIVVMNAESLSPEEEMTKDLLSIIHCFSSRLYGLRKHRREITTLVRGGGSGAAGPQDQADTNS